MINCVVAVERSQGIGFNGSMPWPHLKGDMAWFKKLTTDHVVIMGSVTWKSLLKPLPNRINVVISKDNHEGADHCFKDPGAALDICRIQYPKKEIFIMGGQNIYDQYMDMVDRFYITEIDAAFPCDKFFNLDYVRKNFPYVTEIVKYADILPYTIKEYQK
jgi:dihydrofolate reductase